ncbi:putative NRPS-like protein biosynthetic cluster [Elasticomyces elasticus]|nr:putative NRPS-like protein biosynthetic cluster [Elasticomyces elasticus]
MPFKSPLSVTVPQIDLPSFLLDGIPELGSASPAPCYTEPYLFSAERPDSKNLSLIQFRHLVKCFASGLQSAGLQRGDHVMLVSPNYIQAMIVILGTIAAGGVSCTAQPDLKIREYIDQFLRDEPRFLFVCNEQPLRDRVLEAWKATKGDPDKTWLFDECVTTEERLLEARSTMEDGRFWSELLDHSGGPVFQWERLTTEEQCRAPCMLLTTSGTSGLRKAAIYSHRMLVAAWTGTAFRAREDTIRAARSGKGGLPGQSRQRILHTISISRALGACYPLVLILSRRAKPVEVYFMSKTYTDMMPYLRRIQTLRITEVNCAPFTLVRIFKTTGQGLEYDFSHLKSITAIGAPSSQSSLDGAREFLIANGADAGVRVERALGITEAAALVSTWHLADPPECAEACQGRLEPNIEAVIMAFNGSDDDDNEHDDMRETGLGEPGELWLRGPSFIHGYYKNDEATRAAFTADGWFKTGDVGYFREDGKLFLVDRKKDILKTPDNIPPAYIEGVLLTHPDILDAGVVGIYEPSRELQLVRAYIVKRPSSTVSEDEICAWMERESATTAHLTAGVEFLDELPRNNGGKLLRRELKERARKTCERPDVTALTLSRKT